MTALPFLPLFAGWAIFHRWSTRPGWGFVGVPPTRLQVACRRLSRDMRRLQTALGVALVPAVRRLADAMVELDRAIKRGTAADRTRHEVGP